MCMYKNLSDKYNKKKKKRLKKKKKACKRYQNLSGEEKKTAIWS